MMRSFCPSDKHFCSVCGTMWNIPPGYTFKPSDEDLVYHYLYPKNQGTKLPPNQIIEHDVYRADSKELRGIYELNGDGPSWYFFSKHRGGSRPDSIDYVAEINSEGEVKDETVNGFWETNRSSFIEVKDTAGKSSIKGIKLSLEFVAKPQQTQAMWFMNEYSLHPTKPGDTVLCKVYTLRSKGAGSWSDISSQGKPDSPCDDSGTVIQYQPETYMSATVSEEVDQPLI